MSFDQSDFFSFSFKINIPKLKWLITGSRYKYWPIRAKLEIMNLILLYIHYTLCPSSLFGGCVLVRSHNRITLSIPADATYLHVGCRSRDMIDSLCPLRVLIKQGSYSLFIVCYLNIILWSIYRREVGWILEWIKVKNYFIIGDEMVRVEWL